MITIKTNQKSVWGKKITLPVVGETEVDEEGKISVDEDLAKILLDGNNWELDEEVEIDEEEVELEEEDDLEEDDDLEEETEDDEEGDLEEDETEETEEVDLMDAIDEMSLEDMIKLAKDSKLTGYNLFKNDENKMRAFMKKKLSVA